MQTAKFKHVYEPDSLKYEEQSTNLMNRFNTEQTEDYVYRSSVYNHSKNEEQPLIQSKMNVSELDLPKDDTIYVNGVHRIDLKGKNQSVYPCEICDRLRAICPYKDYITYQYCNRCDSKFAGKGIINPKTEGKSQNLASESSFAQKHKVQNFQDTRGASCSQNDGRNFSKGKRYKFEEVNKVRFVQSKNQYPIKVSQRKLPQNCFSNNRVRSITTHPTVCEEVIFYPVIHNKLIYQKSGDRPHKSAFETTGASKSDGRNRYNSLHQQQSHEVSDFLAQLHQSGEDIISPSNFNKLANSMRRDRILSVNQ